MNLEWMLIRGTGLVAYALLAGSTIWGLMLSSKLLGRLVKAKPLTWVHEGLAVGSLLATGAHMFFLWSDDYIEFGPRELFVPGASTWEPLAVAFGIMAFYVMFVVSASFYVKRWIGQSAWRAIHFLAFGTFAAAAIHGVLAGTDTQEPAVLILYAVTVATVALLLVIRISQEVARSAQGSPADPLERRSERRRQPDPAITNDVAPAVNRSDSAATGLDYRVAALAARRAARSSGAPKPASDGGTTSSGAPASGEFSTEKDERLAASTARRSSANGDQS
jgi:hypothetical protein